MPESNRPEQAGTGLETIRRLFLDSPTPMALWLADAGPAQFNQPWLDRAGLEPAALWPAIQPQTQQALLSGQAQLAEAGPTNALADGRYSFHPLHEGAKPIGVMVMWEPGVRAREALHEGDAKDLAALVQSMNLGYCLVEVLEANPGDMPDYRYLDCNRAFIEHSGLAVTPGARVSEISSHREPFWPQAFQDVLATGCTLTSTVVMTHVDRAFKTCIMRVGGAGSRTLAVLLENVTAQHHATQLLVRSEQTARAAQARADTEQSRLAAVVDAAPAAVVVVDRGPHVILANACAKRLWGDIRTEHLGTWTGYWADGSPRHGQRLATSQWPLHRALMGESSTELLRIISPRDSQEQGVFLCSAVPIWSADGRIDGAVVVSVAITDRIEAEQALKRSLEDRDLFLAMLAHELRNPLAPILTAADLMSQRELPQASVAQCSQLIARQTRHMRGLIDDLLDSARLHHGLITLDRRALTLGPLIEEALEQCSEALQRFGHQVILTAQQDPIPLKADRKRLVQILANLINNAAKYTPAGGRIEIRSTSGPEGVEVSVIDNGIGMCQETLCKAFDLFGQAERSPDRQEGGLGLGLPLAKKLVDLHGGQITARSAGHGQGSCLTVWLPAAPVDQAPAAPEQQAPPRGPGLRVLLVDDNKDAAATLALYLQACGHLCETAHDAEAALALASRFQPQACVLDIGLPGMDGRQLAQRLRSRPEGAQALMLALSGYAHADDRHSALQAGFDHYLVKPVDIDQLTALLDRFEHA